MSVPAPPPGHSAARSIPAIVGPGLDGTSEDIAFAQAFADVVTITLLQDRAARETALINEQLKRALNSAF